MFEFPEKMKRVFKDSALQEEFEREGFIIVDFYSPEEIREATDLYYRVRPVAEQGFYPSTFSSDKNYRIQADNGIKKICERSIEKYLMDIKVVCGSFIVKTPGPESGMSVHQDMSLIDESRFTGINIWVPLVDLTVNNGTLFILPKSHRLFPTYRGSSIPEFFDGVMAELIDFLEPVIIRAGQAVIFDQSIIHYSPPNYSEDIRIVTNTYFTHRDTEYRTYYWDKNNHVGCVEAFAQDDSFMTDYEQFGDNIRDRPKVGTSLGLVSYDFPKVDVRFFEERYKRTGAIDMIAAAAPLVRSETQPAMESGQAAQVRQSKSIFRRIKEFIT